MDELLEAFHNEMMNCTFPIPEYTKDSSQFNVVDGEESDHGEIKYFSPDKDVLLAVKIVHGGDNEDFLFTKAGKEYLTELYIETLKKHIKQIPTYNENISG